MLIDYKLIGSRIKKQRELLGMTQEILSEKVGITVVYLSKIENGKVHPTLEALSAICGALGCDIGLVFSGAESESDHYQNETVVQLFRKCSPRVKPIALKMLEELASL